MKPCQGLVGFLFGHKFEAHYTEGEPKDVRANGSTTATALAKIIEASKPRTYVCSVCARCGALADEGMKP